MSLKAEYLNTLIAIQRCGSLSAAAVEQGITVSSVSYAVRQLEQELGEALLDRQSYRVKLTTAGEAAVDYGREILRLHESLYAQVHKVAEGWESELRIAFTNMLRSDVLYQWVSDFYELNSGTRICISREVYTGTWDALYDKRADIVLGASGRPPHEVDVHHVSIGQRELVFVMAANHPLAQVTGPITLEQVQQYRLVDSGDSSRLLQPDKNSRVKGCDQLTVPDLFAQREALMCGLAVGYMPLYFIEEQLASDQLVIRDIENHTFTIELSACWRRSSRGKALEWFTHRLQQSQWREQLL